MAAAGTELLVAAAGTEEAGMTAATAVGSTAAGV
jgi:hypothetical protein